MPCHTYILKSSRLLIVAGKKRGGQKVATPQEVLAQGLMEAKHKRLTAHEQLTRQSIVKPKSLVHDSADTRDSLLSSTPAIQVSKLHDTPGISKWKSKDTAGG